MKLETTNAKVTFADHAARVISRVTNPCLLCVIFLFSLVYFESINIRSLVIWGMLLLLFLVVLPLIYVYVRKYISKSSTKLLADPTLFLKQHPKDVLIIGILFGLPSWIILAFFKVPSVLLCTHMALLVVSLLTALCYTFYRVSYHISAVIVLVIMGVITWGQNFTFLVVLIPLVGWAKYRLHEHSIAQMAIAVALSAIVTTTTLNLLG